MTRCTEVTLQELTDEERVAYAIAESYVPWNRAIPADIAATLLKTIRRLEHEAAHAGWGALVCNHPLAAGEILPPRLAAAWNRQST